MRWPSLVEREHTPLETELVSELRDPLSADHAAGKAHRATVQTVCGSSRETTGWESARGMKAQPRLRSSNGNAVRSWPSTISASNGTKAGQSRRNKSG